MRNNRPEQVVAVKSFCASTDASIKAVADRNDPNIHLIVDRGFGDIKKLLRSFSFIAAHIPVVNAVLNEHFDCNGTEKIKNIRGKLLFIVPGLLDQVLDYGKKRNFTRDLHDNQPNSSIIEMEGQDHWSKWNAKTFNQV